MTPITVDAEEVIMALEYHGYDAKYVFDRETNELLNYTELREAWFRFHNAAFLELTKEWLIENEIEATLKTRDSETA